MTILKNELFLHRNLLVLGDQIIVFNNSKIDFSNALFNWDTWPGHSGRVVLLNYVSEKLRSGKIRPTCASAKSKR